MRGRWLALVAVLCTVFAVYAYQRGGAAVGRAAPDFTLPDAAGRQVSLSGLRGRVVLLEFWASWCEVCRRDTPALRSFAERYADRVAVVGVDWREPEAVLRQWVAEYRLGFPNLRDADGLVARRYGVRGVPEAWWIGPDGVARLHTVGPADFEQLQAQYAQVAGRPARGAPPAPLAAGGRIAALAAGAGRLWLAVDGPGGGLWERTPAGGWSRAALAGPMQAVAAAGPDLLAVVSQAGWFGSNDGGSHWAPVRSPAVPGPAVVAGDAGVPGVCYAWVDGRLWRSADFPAAPFVPLPARPPVGDAAVRALAARGPQLALATDASLLLSSDGGAHWRTADLRRVPLGSGEFASAAAVLEGTAPLGPVGAAFGPDGTVYLAGPDGIYAVAPGATEAARLQTAPARAFAALAADGRGGLWAVAPDGDLYSAAGGPGGPWTLVPA